MIRVSVFNPLSVVLGRTKRPASRRIGTATLVAAIMGFTHNVHASEPLKLANLDNDRTRQQAAGLKGIDLKLSAWLPPKEVDLTAESGSIWTSLQRGFSIPDIDGQIVRKRERALLTNHRALKSIFKASQPYIHFVLEECNRRGLPTELALLPFVESKFNPHAYSRAKATGLWQFIPSTGRYYQLAQNEWVDERKDLIESTRAALDYLTYLYEMQGDWHLALISYNWGPGAVNKAVRDAIEEGKDPILENLNLPLETKIYVPKLQAYKNIVAQPDKYGFDLPDIKDKPYFSILKHNRDLDFRELARLAQVDLREIRKLNPALNQPVMYAAQTQKFLVPSRYKERIEEALSKYKPPKPYRVYRVRNGDTLGHIAAKFDVKIRDIQTLNSLGRSTLIKPGMSLTLPNPVTRENWPS